MSVIVFIRDSQYGMPIVQSVHLVGLTLLLATVLVLNLRLAGGALKDSSLDWLAQQLRPWMIAGLVVVVLSGALIFVGTPEKYLASNPFRVKMAHACPGDTVPVRHAPPVRRAGFRAALARRAPDRRRPVADALVHGRLGRAGDCLYPLNTVSFGPASKEGSR